jgi:hypothetical protein
MNMLRVKAIPGEPTRFWVESGTLQCTDPQCGKMYNRRTRHRLVPGQAHPTDYLHIGDPCPACGTGTLDVRFHVVDISDYSYNASCSCEFFEFCLRPELTRMLPSEQGAGKHRCSHIIAARDFALDVALHAHEHVRYKDANGQREEKQP